MNTFTGAVGALQRVGAMVGLLALLVGCALTDRVPGPTPDLTPPPTATPEIPTATATLVVQRAASPTRAPAPAVSTAAATATRSQASPLAGRTSIEKPAGELVVSEASLQTLHVSKDRRHYAYVTHNLAG